MVDCATDPSEANVAHASQRLGVILKSYTVYLDLWIADRDGRIIASGRPQRYPAAIGTRVNDEEWFRRGLATADGNAFVVGDVSRNRILEDRAVATYATAIRANGDENGDVLGVLGIFFDWEPQAAAVVEGVRLEEQERNRCRCLLLDARNRVIASSDGRGVLTETYPLRTNGARMGHYTDKSGHLIGFSVTPGYETYQGLGWYGVIEHK